MTHLDGKRIALVANTSWYLYNFRLSLVRHLQNQGARVFLISPPDEYAQRMIDLGLAWEPWAVGRKSAEVFNELHSLQRLAQIYRKIKPDLVHHFTVKPVLYGSLAAQWSRVPAVVNSITGRGYVFLGQGLRPALLRGVVGGLYRLAFLKKRSAAIFENDADRQFFINAGLTPKDRSYLIESVGVDTDYFHYQPEPASGPPLVILPSRMLWDKGVGVFVEAARLVKAEQPAVRFALVGSPDPGNPSSVSDQQIQQWTQTGAIEYWGWQEDMRAVYAQSHIVVLPSFGEGMPKSLLEAAACGRPIITTDVPGCRETILPNVTGLLTPVNDPQALASATLQLINDPASRAAFGKRGSQHIQERFSEALVNAHNMDVYARLLFSGRPTML